MIKILSNIVVAVVFLIGSNALAKPLSTEKQFKENLARQIAMTPLTLEQLYALGVIETSRLKLEYFFYANEEEKAKSLHEKLASLGYSGDYGRSAGDPSTFVVTGWTTPIKMDHKSAVNWTKSMCEIGHQFGAIFDGWGTSPEQ